MLEQSVSAVRGLQITVSTTARCLGAAHVRAALPAGLSQPLTGEEPSVAAFSQVGTVPYTAPETFATDRVSKQTDIYAFGILRAHPLASQ